jgi:hypothetical protein
MYHLSHKEIEFIENDIRLRGIALDDLQQNLLDHVCCIVESEMEEGQDFHVFYEDTIRRFYKNDLKEIEVETYTLLNYKNYYLMKKTMFYSGLFSVSVMTLGIWFKFMHYPGAAFLLPFGLLSSSLIFLPLLFLLKAKEVEGFRQKLAVALGGFAVVLIPTSFIFKIMHWPGTMAMIYGSALIMLLAVLPLYLANSLSNPDKKLNAVTTSLLIVFAYGLLFSMVLGPQANRFQKMVHTQDYLRNEKLLQREQNYLATLSAKQMDGSGRRIYDRCEELKAAILNSETGGKAISTNKGKEEVLLRYMIVDANEDILSKQKELQDLVSAYNQSNNFSAQKIPLESSFLKEDLHRYPVPVALNEIIQIQMFVLQNEREMLAANP